MTDERAVGVDIGGTKIAAGLVGNSGSIGTIDVIATDASRGASSVLTRAISLAETVASRASPRPVAVGVAAGGWIDPVLGRVVGATNLLPGWRGTPLRDAFERALGIHTSALNDVHAIGLAEARLGAGRGRRHCLCVAVGTGIGGAIVNDGRLFTGAHGFAGAIGHMRSRDDGAPCSCGRSGCIESEASGPAIARLFARCVTGLVDPTPREAAGDAAEPVGDGPTLSDVVRALESPDEWIRTCASEAVTTAGARLGRVLGGLANVLDPDTIVVGGGAAAALGAGFLDEIRNGVRDAALPEINPDVVAAELGTAGGVVGAGLVALGEQQERRRG